MPNSHNAGLSGTPPVPNVRFFVYLDESNFRISGEAENKKRRGVHPKAPLSWHYDIRVLKGIIRKHSAMNVDEKLKFMIYGSNIQHGLVHRDLELHTSKVTTFARRNNRREKKVDTSLVSDMTAQAADSQNFGRSAVFAVISGDSDMTPTVERATRRGHAVHVWAWQDSLSGEYRVLEQQRVISLHLLDEFFNDLTMRNSDVPVGNMSIPPNAIVFPKHWKISPEIYYAIRHQLAHGKLVSIKRSNGARDYCNGVAFLPDSGFPDQDVLFRCVLKNLQDQRAARHELRRIFSWLRPARDSWFLILLDQLMSSSFLLFFFYLSFSGIKVWKSLGDVTSIWRNDAFGGQLVFGFC
ncbi:hypothetical protein FCIRC_11550 [Fusarium circinatum]|uniref:NYN domain-containing protein n=1 Tax=Fusarium circinatum TaxID=48490 RepID=A0A8H5T3R5_FUSCI|nr:hypothetical protein FCIRC_11550 [Fusarium circinatum]